MKTAKKFKIGSGNLASAMAVILALSVSLAPVACAAPIKVLKSPDMATSSIETTIVAGELGNLTIPNGSIKIKGNKLSVRAVPEWLFDHHEVLDGRIIDSKIVSSGGTTTVTGLAYFVGGDWLNSLNSIKSPDNIITADGAVLVGRIRAVNADTVDFQPAAGGQIRRLKNTEIKSMRSPRAFVFNIPASGVKLDAASGDLTGDASRIVFSSTVGSRKSGWFPGTATVKEPKSTLAGTEGGVSKGALAVMIGLDVFNTLAPAIVAPIVAPLGDKGALRELRNFDEQERQLQVLELLNR